MKVFTCTVFRGHWPTGTAAVIVARNEKHAVTLLEKQLKEEGLEQAIPEHALIEVSTKEPGAIILNDGNY